MILSIVVPCYNEQEVIEISHRRIYDLACQWQSGGRVGDFEILYVNDGSRDDTLPILRRLASEDERTKVISLSRNCGHQAALMAGLHHAVGDYIVSMDADMQDPPETVEAMLDEAQKGAEVVYGVRHSRQKDTAFKRNTAQFFYAMMRFMGVDIVPDHADFRLISRRVRDSLERFGEVNLFLRGVFPLVGYKSARVYYERQERTLGVSKYPLRKMIAFALEGITSFSCVPLRLSTLVGFFMVIVSTGILFWALSVSILGKVVPGWTSIVVPMTFISGIQFFILGIIGEYVGKIYMETKRRPVYLVEETFNVAALQDDAGSWPRQP
jgi:glycosyltransferase involved in cell wall biosynthesis